ncbi:hypothetical protein G6553_08520 [Nocardioides sp. IC4_145]|uniref:hypothetical protein n=1 Tax=Nocardioides sp. IC4_145 TaxID=2714037 RepID=UPI00140BF113|nr:hypothetical protein [Nocardioides sp. IC4_145]NHC23214.1 hypothetical protein [Nocardioides sp. IC4_145]
MSNRRGTTAGRPRLPWVVFVGVSTSALAGCVVAALGATSAAGAAVVLGGGVVAVGLAGLLLVAILSPLPGGGSSAPQHGSWQAGGAGFVDGGIGAGGDCG